MTYDEIYKPLSRTSFASKMGQAFNASLEIMSIKGQVESDILVKNFLPEEIETFVLNSVIAKEYNNKDMSRKQFIEVMNAIRDFQPPIFYEKIKTDYLKWVLPTLGAVQFESQQYLLFRLYRHHYLFNFKNDNVDVETEFIKKFTRSFDEYAAIVYTFQVLLAQKKLKTCKEYWEKINEKESWFIKNLSLTREQYKEELRQFAKSKADYKYCLRPSYSYPFLTYEGQIYLPTPHLLIQSITTAMMNRLTFENSALREQIGKNACESYIYNIVSASGLFDEIRTEYEYSNGQKTLDLMIRKNDIGLLIDSKLFSPKTALRIYDDKAYNEDLGRITKNIRQAYVHAHEKFNKDYHPFRCDVKNVYAIIVVYQDGYIDLEEIYDRTAKELNIEKGSSEYAWLWQHIGLTDLATLERFMLTETDVLPHLLERKTISDGWLSGRNGTDFTDVVLQYRGKLIEDTLKILNKINMA